tara:strand:+ start:650 stop:985 length:336 start_codon:yes stop_codon:yes gene_type:complete
MSNVEGSVVELLRDKEVGGVVADKEAYRKALLQTLQARLVTIEGHSKGKPLQELYEAVSDSYELFNCFITQALQTKRELSTKARYEQAGKVAKQRAEDLGGYFNGVIKNDD